MCVRPRPRPLPRPSSRPSLPPFSPRPVTTPRRPGAATSTSSCATRTAPVLCTRSTCSPPCLRYAAHKGSTAASSSGSQLASPLSGECWVHTTLCPQFPRLHSFFRSSWRRCAPRLGPLGRDPRWPLQVSLASSGTGRQPGLGTTGGVFNQAHCPSLLSTSASGVPLSSSLFFLIFYSHSP